jgi:HK97 family phage prohead protease
MSELIIQRAMAVDTLEPIGDGWTLYGRAVPYGVDQEVTDDGTTYYVERFAPGAYSKDVAKGARWVNLMIGHHGDEGDRYLGRCIQIGEDRGGLDLAFRIDRSHPQAEEARSGELTGWSVSAHVYRTRVDLNGVHVREECGLSHVAATRSPQYAGAGVLVAREHVVVENAPTPRLEAARAKSAANRVRVQTILSKIAQS